MFGTDILAAAGIIGALNWVEISTLPKDASEYQNSLAVREFYNEQGQVCNATHIGGGVVVTAGHCFNPGGSFANYPCHPLNINRQADQYFMSCSVPKSFPAAMVGKARTRRLYILHHQCDWVSDPYCRPTMKLSPGEFVKDRGKFMAHTADTLPGSSGAGIYNEHHQLVGVHTSADGELNWGSWLGQGIHE